ncbi:hypothetical protein [Pandoraea cepalis]|uniref:hypothetical protein n=1 Tax=Pandoraea cepalis TaxID=2508294 RepID=UPI001582F77F|nr:hypothetical protein [Pandoraea cepalis]
MKSFQLSTTVVSIVSEILELACGADVPPIEHVTAARAMHGVGHYSTVSVTAQARGMRMRLSPVWGPLTQRGQATGRA